jgi:2-phospho-L-lactate guanylyltransferase
MEQIWAIVPIKPLAQAKSRLASVLAPEARRRLVLTMLDHTLTVLKRVRAVINILVVSADDDVALVAEKHAVAFLLEPKATGLNSSLRRAVKVAHGRGASGVLIVPGDLPQMDRPSVQSVLGAASDPPAIVIVPDRKRQGTNMLLLTPPDLIPFSYGPGSFQRHLELAEVQGLHPVVCCLPKLALDTDLPEDLALLDEEMYRDRV